MKKLVIVTMLLSIMLSLFACNNTKNDSQVYSDVTLCNFEQWGPDFQLITLASGFGSVSRNEDKAFVKSGDYSAKLRPMGLYSQQSSNPIMMIPTISTLFEMDYSDFKAFKSITADFYNAEDKDVPVLMGLISAKDGSFTSSKQYVLKSGWNKIFYDLDIAMLDLVYGTTSFKGIYFSFENQKIRDREEAPTIYLDDIMLIKATDSFEQIDINLTNGEIADFESLYQKFIVRNGANEVSPAKLEVVNASDYGITAASGLKTLRVITTSGTTAYGSYPRFTISEKIFSAAKVLNNTDDKRFEFNVYNNSNQNMTFYIEFNNLYMKSKNFVVFPKQWTTISFTIAELRLITNYQEVSSLSITWPEYVGEEKEFFFDNFRIK